MDIVVTSKMLRAKKTRVWELDFLRGICILMMVFDHFMLDAWMLQVWVDKFYLYSDTFAYKLSIFGGDYWDSEVRTAVRIFILFTFLFISGLSCSFSKNNNTRLLKLTAASIVLTVATVIIDSFLSLGVTIIFGILHIIALSLLIYILLQKLTKNKYVLLVFGLSLIVIGILIDFNRIPTLDNLTLQNFIKLIVGTANLGGDSYGVVPYTGVFLIGAFYGKTIYLSRTSLLPLLDGFWHKPVTFVGRNTIWVYLIHQPVMFGLTILIALFSGIKVF